VSGFWPLENPFTRRLGLAPADPCSKVVGRKLAPHGQIAARRCGWQIASPPSTISLSNGLGQARVRVLMHPTSTHHHTDAWPFFLLGSSRLLICKGIETSERASTFFVGSRSCRLISMPLFRKYGVDAAFRFFFPKRQSEKSRAILRVGAGGRYPPEVSLAERTPKVTRQCSGPRRVGST
jgi:hypothetical protein